MRKRARVLLAVVPLAVMALGFVALQAGVASAAKPDITATISSSPDACGSTVASGTSETLTVTVTNANFDGIMDNITVTDTNSDTYSPAQADKLHKGDSVFFTTTATVTGDITATATGTEGNSDHSASADATCAFTIAAASSSPSASASTTGQAATGFNPLPYALASLLLLGMGGSFVLVSKRR